MAQKIIPVVDTTDRSTGDTLVFDGSVHQYVPAPGSWEAVVAALSGKVHRWKFEEASGDFNDEISTLDLVANGSISYQAASPLGFGASFTGGFAESSGPGSIPIGDDDRTILAVWKRNSVTGGAVVPVFSIGANATRQLFQLYSIAISDIRLTALGSSTPSLIVPFGDAGWHLSAGQHLGTGTQAIFVYHDGLMSGALQGGNLATPSANFHVAAEYDDTDPSAITVTDCIVFDRLLAKWELDWLYAALRGELA